MAQTTDGEKSSNILSSVDSGDSSKDKVTVRIYEPVQHYWFFRTKIDKSEWQPFSKIDSSTLEKAFQSSQIELVATDGGRYDVSIPNRERTPVYWKGDASDVQRCSWFYKCPKLNRFLPYEENIAIVLEEEYKISVETNEWNKRIKLENGDTIVIQAPDTIVFFRPLESPDSWDNTSNQVRPRTVRRGVNDFQIDEGEPVDVDHVLFMVHGIGSICDFKFKPVEETVDVFRSIAFNLVQAHYRSSCQKGKVHRVEVLPISWHSHLHSAETGIDKQLKQITLESIPKLRDFANDTIVDVLFYTSPVYSQTIISAVADELNRIYDLFIQRNPNFKGGVSLGGHSLGSLILFDLLCHQHSHDNSDKDQASSAETEEQIKSSDTKTNRKISRRISYMMGVIGTGQPQINYPHLHFEPSILFALGSPIGMFTIVRGLDTLGENFALPTCPGFYNIFHPYDPIAYRIESLIHPDLGKLKPVLIPHHKGRKRMHLELKDTTTRLGADIKERVVNFVNSAWSSFNILTNYYYKQEDILVETERPTRCECDPETEKPSQSTKTPPVGNLNNGNRIDYVLQESPFQLFNDYLFATQSHLCYWESEDTILFMIREIYHSSMGILADSQIPQQSMTIERTLSSPTSSSAVTLNPIIDDNEEKE